MRWYLVDHAQRIIPFEDTDVSDFVTNSLIENGVRIIHSAKVRDVIRKSDHLEVILDFLDGRSEVIEADVTLVSIGRNIELSPLNLHAAGIELNKLCALKTDENCCIKDNIYAAGDITQHIRLPQGSGGDQSSILPVFIRLL